MNKQLEELLNEPMQTPVILIEQLEQQQQRFKRLIGTYSKCDRSRPEVRHFMDYCASQYLIYSTLIYNQNQLEGDGK